MISLAEPLRYIRVRCPAAPAPCGQNGVNITDDKPFLFVRRNLYYLSWGAWYGTSTSPYGPYDFRGTFVSRDTLAPDFRMPEKVGAQWYQQLDFKDRHGGFMTLHGQHYYSMNDLSHSTDEGHPNNYRDSVISYVHFYANGSIAPLVVDAIGVGNYDASVPIEAENFFRLEGSGEKFESGSGFVVQGLTPESRLVYPHVANLPANTAARLRAANRGIGPAQVKLVVDGQLAFNCKLPSLVDSVVETRCDEVDSFNFTTIYAKSLPKTHNLEVRLAGGSVLVVLDSIRFS